MDYVEPYKIKMVEPIEKGTQEQRIEWIKQAGYNLYNLRGNQVFIDLISDSGTGAMSNYQWSEMMLGDECYAGESSYFFLKNVIEENMLCKYFLPTHQGRAAENILYSSLVKNGNVIPGNIHYNTTSSHIEKNGGITINCIKDEVLTLNDNYMFKGDIDLNKLEYIINTYRNNIPFVLLTITCNTLGSNPVSMENIRRTSELCKENDIPLFFDSSRFAENSYLIKMREVTHHGKDIGEIVKEMFSYVDGFVMSGKKDGLSNIGGLIGLNDEKLYHKLLKQSLLYEGYYTHGGMASRDLRILGQGIKEAVNFDYLDSRTKQVISLGEDIKEMGIPVIEPFGGHAIFIDASKFYENVNVNEYPAQLLGYELYVEGGIRGNSSNINLEIAKANTLTKTNKQYSILRLSVPRRTYTNNHMKYVVENLYKVWSKRQNRNKGFSIKDNNNETFYDLNNYITQFERDF